MYCFLHLICDPTLFGSDFYAANPGLNITILDVLGS